MYPQDCLSNEEFLRLSFHRKFRSKISFIIGSQLYPASFPLCLLSLHHSLPPSLPASLPPCLPPSQLHCTYLGQLLAKLIQLLLQWSSLLLVRGQIFPDLTDCCPHPCGYHHSPRLACRHVGALREEGGREGGREGGKEME